MKMRPERLLRGKCLAEHEFKASRIFYVLGGSLDRSIEARKQNGEQPRSEFNLFTERNGATVFGTDCVRCGTPLSLRRRLALAHHVLKRGAEFDQLLVSGEDVGFLLALLSLARRSRKPIWVVLHGSYLESRKFRAFLPFLRRASHIHYLCLSEALRAQMVGKFRFRDDCCHNAGYGVDTAFFQPAPPPSCPLIVSAGSANRDYRTLVRALGDLETSTRIAADSLWRPAEAELGDEAIPPTVRLGSAGDYVGLRALYAQASLVVVPLKPGNFAAGYAVLIEAMAMGRPVIVTRTDAPPDFVVEGQSGLYAIGGDPQDLRRKILHLLNDPQARETLGAAAARLIQTEFSLEAYCEKIEKLMGLDAG